MIDSKDYEHNETLLKEIYSTHIISLVINCVIWISSVLALVLLATWYTDNIDTQIKHGETPIIFLEPLLFFFILLVIFLYKLFESFIHGFYVYKYIKYKATKKMILSCETKKYCEYQIKKLQSRFIDNHLIYLQNVRLKYYEPRRIETEGNPFRIICKKILNRKVY